MPASARTAAAIRRLAAGAPLVPIADTLPRRTSPAVDRVQYTEDEYGKASRLSEATPPQTPRFPVGTLRVTRYREVEELRDIELSRLIETEEEKRGPIVDKYLEWAGRGLTAPPISAVETETGNVKIVDGHHRLAVARARGDRSILGWVALTQNKPLRPDGSVVMPYPVTVGGDH